MTDKAMADKVYIEHTAPDMHTNTDAFSTLRESYTSVEISISVLPANNL